MPLPSQKNCPINHLSTVTGYLPLLVLKCWMSHSLSWYQSLPYPGPGLLGLAEVSLSLDDIVLPAHVLSLETLKGKPCRPYLPFSFFCFSTYQEYLYSSSASYPLILKCSLVGHFPYFPRAFLPLPMSHQELGSHSFGHVSSIHSLLLTSPTQWWTPSKWGLWLLFLHL